ncbi:MAG: 3-phosphoshikimate 1-carboxyvinyltransferase [Candidatus Hydrothermarchaeales archaeon]
MAGKMDARIKRAKILEGFVEAPPSKSYTHRAIIIASLAEGKSVVKNYLKSEDTASTIDACQAFDIRIEKIGDDLVIYGSGGKLQTPRKEIDVQNSGTTIRLMCGIASLDGRVKLTGDTSIQKRPMQPLLDALGQLDVKAYSVKGNGFPPIVIEGGAFKGGVAKIRGDMSSQFISSILIASPYAEENVEIILTTEARSRPYLDITLDIMESFGVSAHNEKYKRFVVESSQRYKGREYQVEGDYSSASYFLALAALTGSEIMVKNLVKGSKQGDKYFLEILQKMGVKVETDNREVTVSGGELTGIEVDLGDTPDLLPTVAALATKAEGRTVIKNIKHARFKECDRVSACAVEFKKFGAKTEEMEDSLIIHGTKKLKGSRVKSYNDHRMAMALTVVGLCADGVTVVEGAECIDISFPGFFSMLRQLGADIEV